jgi:hypothetical protein
VNGLCCIRDGNEWTSILNDMKIHLGIDKRCTNQDMIATHTCTTVTDLCKRVERVGHKLYMDVFPSPDLFQNLIMRKRSSCETVRPNHMGLPQGLHNTRLGLEWGNIWVSVWGDLTALVWKDKQDIQMLMDIHNPPADDSFCNNYGNSIKPAKM